MGLEPEMEWILNKGKKVITQIWIQLQIQELTPHHDLRWDIDGVGTRDGVDPKLSSKSYKPNMDLELDLDLELTPKIDLTLILI